MGSSNFVAFLFGERGQLINNSAYLHHSLLRPEAGLQERVQICWPGIQTGSFDASDILGLTIWQQKPEQGVN
jgi:hypothetical protein